MEMVPTPNQIQYRIDKARDRKAKALAAAKKETNYIAELSVSLKERKAAVAAKAAAKVAKKAAKKPAAKAKVKAKAKATKKVVKAAAKKLAPKKKSKAKK